MKLYKYRDLSDSPDASLERLFNILRGNVFWCARPSTLNDPKEFIWECDYEPTDATTALLTAVLIQSLGRTPMEALAKANTAVVNRRIEPLARHAFEEMIDRCRREIGLACFATSADNEVMWRRYGGNGNGVCIEIDVPDELLDNHLFRVEYLSRKILSVDQLLAAYIDPTQVRVVYSVALLSKPSCWAPEEEVRFVSSRQDVAVRISDSTISSIVLGSSLPPDAWRKIRTVIGSLPYHLSVFSYGA